MSKFVTIDGIVVELLEKEKDLFTNIFMERNPCFNNSII